MSSTVTLKESVIDDLRWFGEKRGSALLVRSQEFTAHHDSDPAE
jgi:hypothetical protein